MSCVKTDQVKPSRWKVRVSASPRKNSQASQRRANMPLLPGSTRSEPEIMDFPKADSERLSISVLRSLPGIAGELAPGPQSVSERPQRRRTKVGMCPDTRQAAAHQPLQ